MAASVQDQIFEAERIKNFVDTSVRTRFQQFVIPNLAQVNQAIAAIQEIPEQVQALQQGVGINAQNITTISKVLDLRTNEANQVFSQRLTNIMANIGNFGMIQSLFGNFGMRENFEDGYNSPDVVATGRTINMTLGAFRVSELLNTTTFKTFTSQFLLKGQLQPGNGTITPFDQTGLTESEAQNAVPIIPPGGTSASQKVTTSVKEYSYNFKTLIFSRWPLAKRQSWRVMGAMGKRIDDIATQIRVFTPIMEEVADIGKKWGQVSSMVDFINNSGYDSAALFMSDLWKIGGGHQENMNLFLEDWGIRAGLLGEFGRPIGFDLGQVSFNFGKALIPVPMDLLWDGAKDGEPLVVREGDSSAGIGERANLLIGAREINFANARIGPQMTGEADRVRDFIRQVRQQLQNDLGERPDFYVGSERVNYTAFGGILGLRNEVFGFPSLAAMRGQLQGFIVGKLNVFDIVMDLKKKLDNLIDTFSTRISARIGTTSGLLDKAKTVRDDFTNWYETTKVNVEIVVGGGCGIGGLERREVRVKEQYTTAEWASGIALAQVLKTVNASINDFEGCSSIQKKNLKARAAIEVPRQLARQIGEDIKFNGKAQFDKIQTFFGGGTGQLIPGLGGLSGGLAGDKLAIDKLKGTS